MSNLASVRDLLLPGLKGIEGEYKMIETQYKRVFTAMTSDKANERFAEMRLLPLAQVKAEGAAIPFDNNAGERFVWNAEHVVLGLGWMVTREAIEDNQYKGEFKFQTLNVQKVFKETKEYQAFYILNSANVYQTSVGGDGVALCSTAHPVDGGTFANRPTVDMDLGEASLLSASMQIRQQFKDQAGLKIYARPETLIVPVPLWPVAERLIKTELRPGTSDNDVNAIKNASEGGIRSYMSCDYLSSNYAWFIKTNVDGLINYNRRPFATDMDTDQVTQSLICSATERYSFSYKNPRAIWGTFPTS